MNIQLDDGVQFGLGVFETICLKGKKPIFLEEHLCRINRSLQEFGIPQTIGAEEVLAWCKTHQNELEDLQALKIMVSEKNKLFVFRENPYTEEVLERGFRLDYSPVMRNETSRLVFHKTMNYADNILEKRRLKGTGTDEVIFLNSRGQITEGSTTNIFFVKNGEILTPEVSCGLLPGIMRHYVISKAECRESSLYPEDIDAMDECFVTNSLMGIMPVKRLGTKSFKSDKITKELMADYRGYLGGVV